MPIEWINMGGDRRVPRSGFYVTINGNAVLGPFATERSAAMCEPPVEPEMPAAVADTEEDRWRARRATVATNLAKMGRSSPER